MVQMRHCCWVKGLLLGSGGGDSVVVVVSSEAFGNVSCSFVYCHSLRTVKCKPSLKNSI